MHNVYLDMYPTNNRTHVTPADAEATLHARKKTHFCLSMRVAADELSVPKPPLATPLKYGPSGGGSSATPTLSPLYLMPCEARRQEVTFRMLCIDGHSGG